MRNAPTTDERDVPEPSDGELRDRLLASLLLIPPFVATIIIGRWIFLAAILLLTGLAAGEFLVAMGRKGVRVRRAVGVAIALMFPTVMYAQGPNVDLLALLTTAVVGVALVQLLGGGERDAVATVSVTLFGALYVGLLFGHFVLVREFPREVSGLSHRAGAMLLCLPIALTWINDTAAYAVGRRWGRRKLMPRVSPRKSVEGAIGALVVTVSAALPLVWLVDVWVPLLGLYDALAIGLLVSIAGPCGDLIESAFKRDAGIKDVSSLIPGHGGILDRFDSLLLVVPAFYYYLRAAVE